MAVQPRGPDELVLATMVARRYYLDGRTKTDISDELRLSRFKVARLLDTAREQGLVRIEISYPGAVDVDLSARLRDAYDLRHAVVLSADTEDAASLRGELGQAAAELLGEILTPADVLGLAWARTVSAMVTGLQHLPPVAVVQLTGALSRPPDSSGVDQDDSSIDVVREVARVAGGPAYLFFAPFLVDDPAAAAAIRRQPDVARALSQIDVVTTAVLGLGHWAPGRSTLFDAAPDVERQRLVRQGVCAEVGGVFLTREGEPLHTSLSERLVAVSADQLSSIADVIAIPYGLDKQPAVQAALRSGIVTSLVTHASLASRLVESAGSGGAPRRLRP